MKKFIGIMSVTSENDGIITGALNLQVSTEEELPHIGETVDNYVVDSGTISQVIQTGAFYTLDENDKNYNADGTGEYSG